MASSPGKFRQHGAGEDVGHVPHGLVGVDLARRRWCRCRRSPARDAAARTAPGRPASRLRGGRRWRPRRTLRGIYRTCVRIRDGPRLLVSWSSERRDVPGIQRHGPSAGSLTALLNCNADHGASTLILRGDGRAPARDARWKSECATALRGRPGLRAAGRESRSICAPISPGRSSIRPAPQPARHRSDRAPIRPGPAATISRMASCTRFS